jgi:ubiquinone/menaquinone biosynthesis C-methylase UbiE/uncharacterized protein YbaR (Trm112 family)
MKSSTIGLLTCPSCFNDNLDLSVFEDNNYYIKSGTIVCHQCGLWYPIIEYIPLMISGGGLYDKQIIEFADKWDMVFESSNYVSATETEKKQVEHYSSDSEIYDELVTNSSFWKASDKNTIFKWNKYIGDGCLVLDMGCGTGRCAIPLADSGKNVIACDISYEMIRKAVNKSNGNNNIDFIVADVTKLPFRQDIFDFVIGFGILHHVSNPQLVVNNVCKILKKQGEYFALENNKSMLRGIFDILMKVDKLWNEEAGEQPLLDMDELKEWARVNGMQCNLNTSTFLPPHLFRCFSDNLAYKVLTITDNFFQKIPIIKNHGGQIIINMKKI